MKSVLLSIRPKYCELIASGKKTVEIRKNRPKLETPFKCYIYCTKDKWEHLVQMPDRTYRIYNGKDYGKYDNSLKFKGESNGKIIGEFICYAIGTWCIYKGIPRLLKDGCVSANQILLYSNNGLDDLYVWHISNLKIYDEPKELSEFYSVCPEWEKGEITNKCHRCSYLFKNDSDMCYQCSIEGEKHIKIPQSWCYVKERETK